MTTTILLTIAALALTGCAAEGGRGTGPPVAVTGSPTPAAPATPSPSPTRLPGQTEPGTVPPVVDHGPRTAKRLVLTFDSNMTADMQRRLRQGGISYANLRVLDILEREHVPTTFFLAGKWVESYPELTRRIAANPRFELASHSYEHKGFIPRCYHLDALPAAEMAADVTRSFEVLAPYGGRQTRYFRFPGGCFDDAALRAIAPSGCTVVQFDVVSGDAFGKDPDRIARNVLDGAQPGSIVVMHITEANSPYTDEALPRIITGLRQKGYELVTLGELLGDA